METSIDTKASAGKGMTQWSGAHVYSMAAICLGAGLFVGYFVRGSQQTATAVPVKPAVAEAPAEEAAAPAMPTMDQMKHMAQKSAAPLQEQLKANPNDAELLSKLAKTYFTAHQFPEAIAYAEKAVQADPKHVGNRADLASYQYVSGDADKAIATLQAALKIDANSPQVLFNLGMIKLKAKNDSAGAVAAWKQLLKANPKLPDEKRQMVEKLIATASAKSSSAAAN